MAAARRLAAMHRAATVGSLLLEQLADLSPEDREAVISLIRNESQGGPLADALEVSDEHS